MVPASTSVRRFTGTFVDRTLEAEFVRESFALTIQPFTRFAVSLSAAVFLAYGVHDYFVMPAPLLHEAWAIRYGVAVADARPRRPARVDALLPRACIASAMLLFGLTLNAVVLSLGAIAGGEVGALQTSYAPLFVVLGPFIVRFDVGYEIAFALLTVLLYDVTRADGRPLQPGRRSSRSTWPSCRWGSSAPWWPGRWKGRRARPSSSAARSARSSRRSTPRRRSRIGSSSTCSLMPSRSG